MRLEKEGGGFEPVSGPTHLAAVCEEALPLGLASAIVLRVLYAGSV